jgi:hypothetical protein
VINRRDVLQLFTDQHWVASIEQLLQLPVSYSTIKRAQRAGFVTTVIPGVLRLVGAPSTFRSRAMALQLHVGRDVFISGASAGVLHGLRQMPKRTIECTIGEDRKVVLPPWGRVHVTSWRDPDRDIQTMSGGLRVATPLRTLFRLAWMFNQHRFERAAEDAWHLGLVTPEAAADYLAVVRRSGVAGVKKFEHWLERLSYRTRPSQSGLELDVIDAIRRAGLPEPERQLPLILRTDELIHVDLAWPHVRLGVEPGHSWWHGGDLRQRADQARDRACDEIGWRIVRVDESVRDDLDAFGRQLLVIYEERRRSLRTS